MLHFKCVVDFAFGSSHNSHSKYNFQPLVAQTCTVSNESQLNYLQEFDLSPKHIGFVSLKTLIY